MKDLELLIGIVGMMVISGLVVTLLITLLFEWAARLPAIQIVKIIILMFISLDKACVSTHGKEGHDV